MKNPDDFPVTVEFAQGQYALAREYSREHWGIVGIYAHRSVNGSGSPEHGPPELVTLEECERRMNRIARLWNMTRDLDDDQLFKLERELESVRFANEVTP